MVCDSCSDAVYDESAGLGFDVGDEFASFAAGELGGEIADHICDERDNGTKSRCSCAC